MAELRFEGCSDDTFGFTSSTGEAGDDYDNCASGKPIVWRVKAPNGEGLYVWGLYGDENWPTWTPACWVIGVQQLDEDVSLPSWLVRLETAKRGYSPVLCLQVPPDCTVECMNRTEAARG